MIALVFVLLTCLPRTHTYQSVPRRVSTSIHVLRMNSSPNYDALTLEEIAARYKVTQYGATAVNARESQIGIECADPMMITEQKTITCSRLGGLGLGLEEMYTLDKGSGGLGLIDSINAGGNAEKAGGFKVGDTIMSLSDSRNPAGTTKTTQGLNFDALIDVISSFEDDVSNLDITINRLVRRKKITVEVYGPNKEYVESFDVPAGYGINLRRELQSRDFKLYDVNTARFDSPYQTGDCGGEGTCGTCTVGITEGKELINGKVLVEDKAMKQQGCPPNWRWACRTIIGGEAVGNQGGKIKVILRPQSLLQR